MVRSLALAVMGVLAATGAAHADWLDQAWSDQFVAAHGNPAITLHPDGVSVVLPAELLNEAYAQPGVTTRDVLRAFLNRYSPQCSGVLDLNMAQPNLTVDLSLQGTVALDTLPSRLLDEVLEGMEQVPPAASPEAGSGQRRSVPRLTQVFVVTPDHLVFSIDYAPEKIVHCVAPQDIIS